MNTQIREINSERHETVCMGVRRAIAQILEEGGRVSFYSVAERAQVSRSTLYRKPDLRRLVENARDATASASEPREPSLATERLLERISALEEELAQARRSADGRRFAALSESTFHYAMVHFDSAA